MKNLSLLSALLVIGCTTAKTATDLTASAGNKRNPSSIEKQCDLERSPRWVPEDLSCGKYSMWRCLIYARPVDSYEKNVTKFFDFRIAASDEKSAETSCLNAAMAELNKGQSAESLLDEKELAAKTNIKDIMTYPLIRFSGKYYIVENIAVGKWNPPAL